MSVLIAVIDAADRQAEVARAVMRVAEAVLDALRTEAADGLDDLIAAAVSVAEVASASPEPPATSTTSGSPSAYDEGSKYTGSEPVGLGG